MTWSTAVPIIVVVMSLASLVYTITLARLQKARASQAIAGEMQRLILEDNDKLKARIAELEAKLNPPPPSP